MQIIVAAAAEWQRVRGWLGRYEVVPYYLPAADERHGGRYYFLCDITMARRQLKPDVSEPESPRI